MYVVGLDLAWGQRSPTGVAVLDTEGRLCDLAVAVTDAEVLAAVAPYVVGPCLVAVDAPLVAVNSSGNRPCEAALNRDFARFQAGAHPTNTSQRVHAGGLRGARIAQVLDLDLAPGSTADRRAVEVYPHAAAVALFGLDRTLKYKQKPGRDLAGLRSELLRLVGLLEGLADTDGDGADVPLHLTHHDGWRRLVAQATTATRKSHLRRVEDPVDAVLCAYVGLLAVRSPERLTTYGDAVTGSIVTPTLGR